MATCISESPEETWRIGEVWGAEARPGWIIALFGDLGSGKTQLVKGVARGLGFGGLVHSPTFALINEYLGGKLPLYHLDLYRLSGPDDIFRSGLEEFLPSADGVTVVEWAERWLGLEATASGGAIRLRGGKLRKAWLEETSVTGRKIIYEDVGS